jgi:hypothetical protein
MHGVERIKHHKVRLKISVLVAVVEKQGKNIGV